MKPMGSRSVWVGLLGHLSSGPEANSWEGRPSIAVGSDATLERWPDQGELNYVVIHWRLQFQVSPFQDGMAQGPKSTHASSMSGFSAILFCMCII